MVAVFSRHAYIIISNEDSVFISYDGYGQYVYILRSIYSIVTVAICGTFSDDLNLALWRFVFNHQI